MKLLELRLKLKDRTLRIAERDIMTGQVNGNGILKMD